MRLLKQKLTIGFRRSLLGVLPLTFIATLAQLAPRIANAGELTMGGDTPPPPPPLPPAGTPGSTTPPPIPGSTAARLDEASTKDSGVGLHFLYLQPEVGFGFAKVGKVIPLDDSQSGAGASLGIGGGLEFVALQLGVRYRNLLTSKWNLHTVGGELNYQPGSGKFWPRYGLNIGYAWMGGLKSDICGQSCDFIDIGGLNIGARAGFQYYVSPTIELGGDATLDFMMLKRKDANVTDPTFKTGESSSGFRAALMLHLGWHYP